MSSSTLKPRKFSLGELEQLARDQMAVEAAIGHAFAAIPPQALKALVGAVKAARNPDLFELFDDTKVYPAQQRLAVHLAVFDD